MATERTEAELRVLFIGAGAVNFGAAATALAALRPWDHSRRLEKEGGVRVVAIADPDLPKAKQVLERKLAGAAGDMYHDCALFASYRDAIQSTHPDIAFIGVPPHCHGSLEEPRDIELQCLRAGVHIFVEKPVSVLPPEQFGSYVEAVEEAQRERRLVVSVGYMFRYHPAVEKMRAVLQQHGRPLIVVNARYNCAYSNSYNPYWWDKDVNAGPIVEQATHFCDLLRHLGGEVALETVSAISVPASDSSRDPGYLSAVPAVAKEEELPLNRRAPRLTSAHLHFQGGGVGTLTHGITLHGHKYETAIEVWADGLRLSLEEPYFPDCRLRIRQGNTDEEQVEGFPNADPYLGEVQTFLAAVRSRDPSKVRSSYRDAAKTYQLSWAIRRASEKN